MSVVDGGRTTGSVVAVGGAAGIGVTGTVPAGAELPTTGPGWPAVGVVGPPAAVDGPVEAAGSVMGAVRVDPAVAAAVASVVDAGPDGVTAGPAGWDPDVELETVAVAPLVGVPGDGAEIVEDPIGAVTGAVTAPAGGAPPAGPSPPAARVAVVAIAAPLPTAAAAPSGLGLLADVDVVATPDAVAGPRMLPPTARSVAGPVAGVAVAVGGVPLTIGVAGPSDPLVGTGLSAPVDDGWAVAVDRSSAAASFWPCRERWLVVGDVADPEALLLPSPVGAAVPVPSSPEDPVAAAPAVE
jgi:hypothetical protein